MKRLILIALLCIVPATAHAFKWSNAANEFDMSATDKVGHMKASAATTAASFALCDAVQCEYSPEVLAGVNLVAWWLKGPTYDTWKSNPTGTSPGDGLADVIGVGSAYITYKLFRHFYPRSDISVVPTVTRDRVQINVAGAY